MPGTLRALLPALLLLAGGGCNSAGIDAAVKKIFKPRLTPQQYLLIAVSDDDPDIRRDAAALVADSKAFDADWAIKGFTAIALLETDTQTRCVAIRALGRSNDVRAVAAILKILNHRDHPPGEVIPPNALCRWDATMALADLSAGGTVPDELKELAQRTLLASLRGGKDRHTRVAGARGLASYPDPASLQGLIDGLRDDDFAVVYRCEMSLVALTGETHDCDPYLWQEWYKANQSQAFAKAGNVPESRQPPYSTRLGRSWYKTRQFFAWLFPGKKE